jgi:hypothetical protein
MTAFVPWDQKSPLEQAQITYSDAHKDAYGFRPRDGGVHNPQTLEEYEAAIEKCCETIGAEEERERLRCIEAQRNFEAELVALQKLGAQDREQALRWWLDVTGVKPKWLSNPRYHTQDIESAVYGVLPIPLWNFILPEVIPGYKAY